MSNGISGEKIAILVANGFCEKDLAEMQRALQPMGALVRVISMDTGLVNGWNGTDWGLSFAADATLNTALSADYAALVIAGGQKSVEKLKLTAHTRRFVNGFLDTGKPVVISNEAVDILAHIEKAAGRTLAAPESLSAMIEQAGAVLSSDSLAVEDNLMTGDVTENIDEAVSFLDSHFNMEQAA